MTSPTIPPHAVSLWLEDDSICMDLPAIGSHLSHRLTFPNNAQGLNRMMHLLASRSHLSKIGEAGDLTQHQVNARLKKQGLEIVGKMNLKPGGVTFVRRIKKDSFSPALRQGARDVLRRLGLT